MMPAQPASQAIFGANQLAKIVAETLPPPDEHRLVIVGAVDRTGAQVVANFTSQNGQWNLQAAYRHDWTGDDSVAAKVIFKL